MKFRIKVHSLVVSFFVICAPVFGNTVRTEKRLKPIVCPAGYNVIVEGKKADCHKTGSLKVDPECLGGGTKQGGYSCAVARNEEKPIECKDNWSLKVKPGADQCEKEGKAPKEPKKCDRDFVWIKDYNNGQADKCIKPTYIPTERRCPPGYREHTTITDHKKGTFYSVCYEPDSYVDPTF